MFVLLQWVSNPFISRQVMTGQFVNLSFKSVDKILWCYRSNETSSAILSQGTIYLVCSSNSLVCGLNPGVLRRQFFNVKQEALGH